MQSVSTWNGAAKGAQRAWQGELAQDQQPAACVRSCHLRLSEHCWSNGAAWVDDATSWRLAAARRWWRWREVGRRSHEGDSQSEGARAGGMRSSGLHADGAPWNRLRAWRGKTSVTHVAQWKDLQQPQRGAAPCTNPVSFALGNVHVT